MSIGQGLHQVWYYCRVSGPARVFCCCPSSFDGRIMEITDQVSNRVFFFFGTSALTFASRFVCSDNFFGNFRRETVVDQVYQRFDIFDRKAAHAFLSFPDHIGYIDEFILRKTAYPLNKIVTVLRKMVRDRGKDGMERMPRTRTGQVPALRRQFF